MQNGTWIVQQIRATLDCFQQIRATFKPSDEINMELEVHLVLAARMLRCLDVIADMFFAT